MQSRHDATMDALTAAQALDGSSVAQGQGLSVPVVQADGVEVLPAAVAVPNAHALVLQQLGIGGAAHKPQQLLHDTCMTGV